MPTEFLETATELMQRATHVVALTGAGISTPSGIPDFRSPESGLWKQHNSSDVASIYGFRQNPERFYEWIRPLAHKIHNAVPNPAHLALAQMENQHYLNSIITQNIDMLHSRAGSRTVYELHGHLREITCIHCFQVYSAEDFIVSFLETNTLPRCANCGHALKPNVILLGEQLPAQPLIAARNEARHCDVMLVIGSSLEVYPAADLPIMAHRSGASLIVVNLSETPVDSIAKAVIHADAAIVLPQLVDALEKSE
ncbi:MAG: NAD-dependent deacylase [Anaerolineae bacterium]|nr:NAD-dependent deacylase [Anaerolineae bacterium]